jgi:hypothetical protein
VVIGPHRSISHSRPRWPRRVLNPPRRSAPPPLGVARGFGASSTEGLPVVRPSNDTRRFTPWARTSRRVEPPRARVRRVVTRFPAWPHGPPRSPRRRAARRYWRSTAT